MILETLTQGIALVATVIGATCFYSGLARQQLLARPWTGRRARVWAVRWLTFALGLWLVTLHPATAFFTLLTVSMISLILLPILAALWRGPSGARDS